MPFLVAEVVALSQLMKNFMSSFLEKVIRYSVEIEHALREKGGTGSGLYDLASSLRPRLTTQAMQRIMEIASVRNKLAHQYGYSYPGQEQVFIEGCEAIIKSISSNFRDEITLNPDQASDLSEVTMKQPQVKWIEVQEPVRGWDYKSTPERRLVVFKGEGVSLIEAHATFKVPLLFDVPDYIGLVSLLPDHLLIQPSQEVLTEDGVSIGLEATAALAVIDDKASIRRVAIDPAAQEQLALNSILKVVQSVFSTSRFDEVSSDWNKIANRIRSQFSDSKSPDLSFRLVDFTINKFKASDSDISSHRQQKLKEESRRKELEWAHETRLKETEFTYQIKMEEIKLQGAERKDILNAELERTTLEADRAAIRRNIKVEDTKVEIQLRRLADEIEKERAEWIAGLASKAGGGGLWAVVPDAALKIELAKIDRDKEIGKASAERANQHTELIIRGAMAHGDHNALKRLAGQTERIQVLSSTPEDVPSANPRLEKSAEAGPSQLGPNSGEPEPPNGEP